MLFRSTLTLLTLVVLLFAPGCASILADQLGRSRNAGLSADQIPEHSTAQLQALNVSQQFRVEVNGASFSIWQFDPWSCQFTITKNADSLTLECRPAPPSDPATPPPPGRGTLILIPGLMDCKETTVYPMWAGIFASKGYRVFIIDQRAQGRSTGQWIPFAHLAAQDMTAVLTQLQRQNLLLERIGLFGISYGGAVAIHWAAIDPRITTVIALEPYANLRQAAQEFVPAFLGWQAIFFPPSTIQEALDMVARELHASPDDDSPLTAIAQRDFSILLLHGEDDVHLPPTHSRDLAYAAQGIARLVIVPHAHHFTLPYSNPGLLLSETFNWLNTHLAP